MLRRTTAFLLALGAIVFCSSHPALAAKPGAAAVKPAVLQASLGTAGVQSEILQTSDFTQSLFIPDLKGSSVTIDFPLTGLLQGKAFSLDIDGMTALVAFTKDKKLEVVAGDSRIESVIAYGTVSCIIGSVFDMVDNILKNVSNLNVLGIIAAVFTGVASILGCLV